MANITKRGETYRITVSGGYDTKGKQARQYMTWTPPKGMSARQIDKEVERQALLFEEKCKDLVIGGSVKFDTLADEWFGMVESKKLLRPRTIDRMKELRERTYTAIGHLPVNKITARHIQKFIDNLAEHGVNKRTGGGLSAKTQKHHIDFISDVLKYAIDCRLIENNPCARVKITNEQPQERQVYTIDEAQAFLENLKDEPLKYQAFFILAIYGGFRRGELLGLEWKDIDLTTGVINISRTSLYTSGRGVFTDTTKTKGSQRSIKVTDSVISILKQYKLWQTEERLRLGDKWHTTDRLFTTWDGQPMCDTAPGIWLKKFCARKGLRVVNVHSFRHLNASLMISSGADVKTVSAVLGHSNASTTLNIYAHAFAEAKATATTAVADILDTKKQA